VIDIVTTLIAVVVAVAVVINERKRAPTKLKSSQ